MGNFGGGFILSPTLEVDMDPLNVTAVACGFDSTIMLLGNGTAYGFGSRTYVV
jgi:alpha-tubulin suppressor-like RCC1 family protein